MTRVVLDANVLAPGFTSRVGAAGRLIDLRRAAVYELVVSDHNLAEFERTYGDRYYRSRMTDPQIARIRASLRAEAIVTELTISVVGVATQPQDDLVLATAVSANGDYLATRDKQLLKLGNYRDVRIVHPVDLVDILERKGDDAADPGAT